MDNLLTDEIPIEHNDWLWLRGHYVAMYMYLGMDLDDPLLAFNNWEKAQEVGGIRMTIKQYDCTNGGYQYCSGCYQMSQEEYGDHVRVDDLRERLEDMLVQCQYTPEAFSYQIRTLLEELK